MTSVAIDQTAASAQIVAAPAAPGFIRVHGYSLSSKTAGNAIWKDGSGTAYDYIFETGAAHGGRTVPYNPEGVFDLAAGKSLVLAIDGGEVGGVVCYSVRGTGGGTAGI